jgi:PAS domain-containing protein
VNVRSSFEASSNEALMSSKIAYLLGSEALSAFSFIKFSPIAVKCCAVESWSSSQGEPDLRHQLRHYRTQACRGAITGKRSTPARRNKRSVPWRVQRWLQIDGKYELTEQGEPSRLVGVVADITERKNLEQEGKQLSGHLISLQEEERQQSRRNCTTRRRSISSVSCVKV